MALRAKRRVIIGTKPAYGTIPEITGLFVSKPGIDAGISDHRKVDPWLFNSEWGQTARICATGVGMTQTYIYPNNEVGTEPLLHWELLDANGSVTFNTFYHLGSSFSAGTNGGYWEKYTKWRAYWSTDDRGRRRFLVGANKQVAYPQQLFRYVIVQV